MRLADYLQANDQRPLLFMPRVRPFSKVISAANAVTTDYSLHLHPQKKHHLPPTVQIDFDGTMAHHHGGRGILGPPKKNAIALLNELQKQGYRVEILTANPNLDLVGRWLMNHGIHFALVTNVKHPAVAYLDDRAINWKGDMPVEEALSKIKELHENG